MSSAFLIRSEYQPKVFTVISFSLVLGFFAWHFYLDVDRIVPTPVLERLLAPRDELYAVHFHNAERGWAVGKFGLILHTADGGNSWIRQDSGVSKPLTSISFGDERHGFVVGGGGTVLVTRDGRRLWEQRNLEITEHLLEVFALGFNSAFVVGAFGAVLSTNDAGINWKKHDLDWQRLIPDIWRTGLVEPHINAVHFANAREGWLAGEFGLILQTLDGGQTWIRRRGPTSRRSRPFDFETP